MSETITGANGNQFVIGTKTFKTITSISAGGTVGTGNVTVDYAVNSDISFLLQLELILYGRIIKVVPQIMIV